MNDEKSTFRKNFQISRPRTAPRAGRGLGEPDRDNLGRGQRTPTTALEHFYGANGFVGRPWCFGGSFLWFFFHFSPHFKLFLSSPIIVFYYLRLNFVAQTGTRLSRKQLWMLCPVTNARGKSQAGFISKITDTKKNNWENPCVLQPYRRNSPPFSVLALEDLKKKFLVSPATGKITTQP